MWARLKILQGVRTGRKRVLRIMRAHALLSPHRTRRGLGLVHDGTIITDAPGIMWGTDRTRVFTVEQGWCWIFVAVEHWNAECVGWHVCKTGSRYAALEPIAAGLTRAYGSVAADAARGLQLRMDHGTHYLADHFLNQIRYWGLTPSFAFIEQPQTNGVAERFNRTLKEQVIHGPIFQTLDALRTAVAAFVERYNTHSHIDSIARTRRCSTRGGLGASPKGAPAGSTSTSRAPPPSCPRRSSRARRPEGGASTSSTR